MNADIQLMDLFDLISERHQQLRKITEKLWNNRSNIHISNSEWYILTRIYQEKQTTISYVTKHVEISRQATHKLIKQLADKGLVDILNLENNKKEKGLRLTKLGEECYEKYESVKADLESNIETKISAEQVKQLKDILTSDWGI